MASKRQKTLIGGAMVAVGIFQAALFMIDDEFTGFVLGTSYAVLGVAYLWFEVYTVE
jgi:hypothetical protein